MSKLDILQLWEKTLDLLKEDLSKPSFETWLKSTTLLNIKGQTAIIGVSNTFAKDWLENRYDTLIKSKLEMILGQPLKIKFVVPNFEPQIEPEIIPVKTIINELPDIHLNPKYTFDTFVVGNSNRFAHAASLAVAEAPAKAYNPLFIYGGVGLGKTHLMHAIGHYILQNNAHLKVVYVTSETFTNQLINAIRDDKTVEFRNKYRTVDILLIDDIQFLAGKERTQEEFFHTFNTLHEANKQLVISSDRPPKEIPTLEDRLRSRFEWGLLTDIQAPDLETRIAILRKKAQLENLIVPNEVMLYIANKIHSNIRELEGALIRVVAYATLHNNEITEKLAIKALKDILPDAKPKIITTDLIQKIVAKHFNLRVEDFRSRKRTRDIAYPRQIAMYLTRELTELSLPKIGDAFGGRDHTTVMHAHDKISNNRKKDPHLDNTINDLVDIIKAP